MKNTFFLSAALLLATATVNAQSTRDSIAAKYKLLPMPEALTIQRSFPVIGTYQLAGSESATVSVALDTANKGIIWITGLPQGNFKAYLKKAPGTYRILSQKTSAGKQIPEGTLVYDKETSTLNVALGAAYNDAEPTAVFAAQAAIAATPAEAETKVKVKTAKTKTKAKVSFYTATKVAEPGTVTTQAAPAPADQK
jgi:hypothetical protein